MNARREALLAIGALLAAAAMPMRARASGKPLRVAVLFAAALEDYYAAFKDELRSLGYEEGRNLVLDARWANGSLERLPALAAELVALAPDVAVASSTPAIAALKSVTASIPIVMATSADSVKSGFVATLARPGGNITGNSAMNFDLSLKTIALLQSVVPKASRLALLLTRESAYNVQLPEIIAAAQGLRVAIVPLRANTENEIDNALAEARQSGIGGLVVFGDSVFVAHRKQLAARTAAERMPAIYQWRSHVEAGGLMSYGPDVRALWRSAARYVDRIAKGANPANLPVQQPTVFELAVNLSAARQLRVEFPRDTLLRADIVVG
jgi:putative ABC transport system substrate-binding protein